MNRCLRLDSESELHCRAPRQRIGTTFDPSSGYSIASLVDPESIDARRVLYSRHPERRSGTKSPHLYLETEGLVDFAAQLKAKGVPLVKDVHETPWNTREIVIHDDQGHTLYLGEPL